MSDYWEEVVSSDVIYQGDHLPYCGVIVPAETYAQILGAIVEKDNRSENRRLDVEIPVDVEFADLIIVTQSCDLEDESVRFVACCRLFKVRDVCGMSGWNKGKLESLRKVELKEPICLVNKATVWSRMTA